MLGWALITPACAACCPDASRGLPLDGSRAREVWNVGRLPGPSCCQTVVKASRAATHRVGRGLRLWALGGFGLLQLLQVRGAVCALPASRGRLPQDSSVLLLGHLRRRQDLPHGIW